jgi:hypothetical protein
MQRYRRFLICTVYAHYVQSLVTAVEFTITRMFALVEEVFIPPAFDICGPSTVVLASSARGHAICGFNMAIAQLPTSDLGICGAPLPVADTSPFVSSLDLKNHGGDLLC